MDLLHAQTIKDRYMEKMTLKMTDEKNDILGDALITCFILDEEITKNNIADKIPNVALREEMKSSLFRAVRKINAIKIENPSIETVELGDDKQGLKTAYDAFTSLVNETIGKTVAKYKTVVDLIVRQKAIDEEKIRDEYDVKISKLEARLSDKNDQLHEAKKVQASVINGLHTKIHKLERKLSESKAALAEAKRTDPAIVESLHKSLKSLELKNSSLSEALEENNNELSTSKARNADYAEQISNALADKARLEDTLTQAQITVEDLRLKQNEFFALQKRVEIAEAEYEDVKDQLDTLEGNNQVATEIRSMQEDENKLLTEQVTKYKTQLQNLMSSNAKLSAKIQTQRPIDNINHTAEIDRLQRENLEHVERANRLELELKESNDTQDSLVNTIDDLEERLASHLAIVESSNQLRIDLDTTQRSLKIANEQCRTLESSLAANDGEIEEAHDREITELNTIIESLKEQISEQKARAKNIVRELPTLSSSMITASGHTDASLVALNMELKSKNKSLEDQVKSLVRRLSSVKN